MLFIEFQQNISTQTFLIKYRNVDDTNWSYLEDIDIKTLNLLLQNLGVVAIYRQGPLLSVPVCTGQEIKINYCGAPITLYCGNKPNMNPFAKLNANEVNRLLHCKIDQNW